MSRFFIYLLFLSFFLNSAQATEYAALCGVDVYGKEIHVFSGSSDRDIEHFGNSNASIGAPIADSKDTPMVGDRYYEKVRAVAFVVDSDEITELPEIVLGVSNLSSMHLAPVRLQEGKFIFCYSTISLSYSLIFHSDHDEDGVIPRPSDFVTSFTAQLLIPWEGSSGVKVKEVAYIVESTGNYPLD